MSLRSDPSKLGLGTKSSLSLQPKLKTTIKPLAILVKTDSALLARPISKRDDRQNTQTSDTNVTFKTRNETRSKLGLSTSLSFKNPLLGNTLRSSGLALTSTSALLGASSSKHTTASLTSHQDLTSNVLLTTNIAVIKVKKIDDAGTSGIPLAGSRPLCSSTALFGPSCKSDLLNLSTQRTTKADRLQKTIEKEITKRVKHSKQKVKSSKKSKREPTGLADVAAYGRIERPNYDFGDGMSAVGEMEIPEFVPPEKDEHILRLHRPVHDIDAMKRSFINAVSASLIRAPDFKESRDPVRLDLLAIAERVAFYDAEFIMKVSLYTRNELNIRTTANFMLAFSGYNKAVRPFLRKYYKACVRLPSDWIDVAEQYQVFYDRSINFGSLPAALRRSMVAKFPDFDQYQLGKYNKDSSGKKKKKKAAKEGGDGESGRGGRGRGRGGRGRGARGGRGRGRGAPRGEASSSTARSTYAALDESSSSSSDDSDSEEEENVKAVKRLISGQSETEEELARRTFTLKQLIRKLHVTEPVENVMCLIGKKYPSTLDEFYLSRLPGTYDEERAGKRMKLPTPETWETQVSSKGNKASTWESLIDHKKLPFMAMLRNLRNMIKAGISQKHHTWVVKKLTDEGAVANSKQFPFRFFSAYQVLEGLENDYETNQQDLIDAAVAATSGLPAPSRGGRGARGARGGARGRGRGRGGKGGATGKDKPPGEVPYDKEIIQRYRKALDTSVKIATVHNVKPIQGTTIILCNLGTSMSRPCTSARGLGKPRQVSEVAVLLGLMCKYSCEESQFIVYGADHSRKVELQKGTILHNMESVLRLQAIVNTSSSSGDKATVPQNRMTDLLRDRVQIDNIIMLSDGMNLDNEEGIFMTQYLKKYRRIVNPNLLFVSVDLSGSSCGFDKDIQPGHENDIYIAGYSDQILRFIAERGDGGQLIHVENIDKSYELIQLPRLSTDKHAAAIPRPAKVEKPLSVSFVPRWRTARVFISSTFRDMHGERDLLTRFVFPELRARAARKFINVSEVDLRWGVTEEETKSNKALEICLSEVARCHLFLGILGERYGWVPDKYAVPDTPEYDWVREYAAGASVTELEMYSAALCKPAEAAGKASFYFRDNTFSKDIPQGLETDFMAESPASRASMERLKSRVRTSGVEVYEDYPCRWGGMVAGAPVVVDLEDFGLRVLNNVWNALRNYYPDDDAVLDELSHEAARHDAFLDNHRRMFVGRKVLMKQTMNILRENPRGLLMLHGKPGSGKSAFMAQLMQNYMGSKMCDGEQYVLSHCMGATPGSTNITATLRRLCQELRRRFSLLTAVPEDYKNLVVAFEETLKEASNLCSSPLALFIDGADLLEDSNQARMMLWLPENLPPNVLIVVTVKSDTEVYKSLTLRKPTTGHVGALELLDKADVVREMLAVHRKQLDESPFNNQMKLLVSKKEANVPLYLSLACEELRVFGLFDKMKAKLMSLPHTIPQLLQEIMVRLEADHGEALVCTALSLLVCARHGLTEEELRGVLSLRQALGDEPVRKMENALNVMASAETAIAPVTFAKLLRGIQGFLRPNPGNSTNHLSLAHAEIGIAVRQRYFKAGGHELEAALHRLLAGYFMQVADSGRDDSWQGKDDRAFSELPYHLMCGGCYPQVENILTSLQFIHKKCHLGMAPQLLEDFLPVRLSAKTADKDQKKLFSNNKVDQYKAFVSRNVHILSGHPALTWQQALNEPSDTGPALDIRRLLADNKMQCSLMEWTNKPQFSDPCVMTINNLPDVVTCVAVSPDGLYFACGGKDCIVRTYELATGKEVKSFTGHSADITDVCFAGTSRLCTCSADNTLSLWDAHSGHRVQVIKKHKRRVNRCASDSEGKHIVSVGWDCGIYIWKASDGKSEGYLKGDDKPVNCVAFHPEGQLVATGHWDSAIRIFDIWHRTRKAVLRGHVSSVRDVAYSPSGRHIASASLDGEVKLWSATQGTQVGNISGHSLPINRLTFATSGFELITVSDDHKVKIWSGHLGKLLSTIGQELDEWGAVTSVDISAEGDVVLAGYHSGHVRQFDLLSGLLDWEKRPHDACVTSVKYSKDATRFLTGSEDMAVRCKIMITDPDSDNYQDLKGHTLPVISVAYGERFLVSTSHDCTALVYNSPSNLPGNLQPRKPLTPLCVLQGQNAPVSCCSFNADETQLATGSRDMSLFIWNVESTYNLRAGKMKPEMEITSCHSDWVNSCCWSDVGDFIVTGGNDFNLKLWDAKTGEEKVSFTGHQSAVNSVYYSYGCIVSGSADGLVKVWSHRGTEITTLYGHSQRVNACALHVRVHKTSQDIMEPGEITSWAAAAEEEAWQEQHDKSKLNKKDYRVEDVVMASASDDGTVRLWQPLESNELACYTGHSDRVLSVATAKNGTICTSSLDKSVKQWRAREETMATIEGHNGEITGIVFSQSGRYMASTARDSTLKLWRFPAWGDAAVPALCYTVKADSKAVNAVCFSGDGDDVLVTGSDSGEVRAWRVVETPRGPYLKRAGVYRLESPVTKVVRLSETCPHNVAVTAWSGQVVVVNMREAALVQTEAFSKSISGGRGDWVMAAELLQDDNGRDSLLVTGSTGETLEVWTDVLCGYNSKGNEVVRGKHVQRETKVCYSGDSHLPKPKRNANWITAIGGSGRGLYVGDVHGQLTPLPAHIMRRLQRGESVQQELAPKRVHSSTITACLVKEGVVFTASKDQTIKVWGLGMNQIGQFFGQSPFTSLAAGMSHRNHVQLVAGDALGTLSFLNWKQ